KSVVAISSNDVWAVGDTYTDGFYYTLTEHWDGTQWTIVTSANPGKANHLEGLAAVSSNDVWAVGEYSSLAVVGFQPIILHWNGTAWTVAPAAPTGPTLGILYGVVALAGNDMWAVGHTGPFSDYNHFHTVVERYGGIFSDVHPTNYFYEAVAYLESHGAVSG